MKDQESTSYGWNPEYEWPGSSSELIGLDDVDVAESSMAAQRRRCFRLVVKHSPVLSSKRRVAVLDAYDEVQIGRDPSTSDVTPRIRLKDMEVSKLHITLYWDHTKEHWAIVDMGSKHGTFIKSIPPPSQKPKAFVQTLPALSDHRGTRLSPSRNTSLPRSLCHLDELSVGSTVFVVHIHTRGVPCDECRSDGDNDIPLFTTVKSASQKVAATPSEPPVVKSTEDPKKALSLLRRTLLSRHAADGDKASVTHEGQKYVDRSARRRSLHPYSRSSSPGSSARHMPGSPSPRSASTSNLSFVSSSSAAEISSVVMSAPPAPLTESNVGHRLLAKQGWISGNALGSSEFQADPSRSALIEPLAVQNNAGRTGLGMKNISAPHSVTEGDWKEQSKQRRWEELRHQAR